MAAQTQPTLLMYSGGSSLDVLDAIVFDELPHEVTLVPVDERATNIKRDRNRWQMRQRPFFLRARAHGWLDALDFVHEPTLYDQMDSAVRAWMKQNPRGVIFALLGIGEDGHTAGLISAEYSDADFLATMHAPEWFVTLRAPAAMIQNRVTCTGTFLRTGVSAAVVYAAGERKRAALARVLASEGRLKETPARIVHDMRHVDLVTDIDA